MNRYICRDFYEEAVRKAFRTWKRDLQNFHQTLKIKRYIDIGAKIWHWIADLSQDRPRGVCFHRRSPQYYINHWNHHLPFSILTHIYSLFADEIEQGPPLASLPTNYYYSNGSLPRPDGTFGFTSSLFY